MEKTWQSWATENIDRGCDTVEIGNILLKNKFTLPQVREMMGDSFPDVLAVPEQNNTALLGNPLQAKCMSLVEIQRDLARLNPQARKIERRSGVSVAEFLEKYYAANRPVILCDLMAAWQAPKKWTPEYLKQICGKESVEIMAARETNPQYEIEDAPHRKQVKFSAYVDMVEAGGATNDYYLTARNNFFNRPGVRPLLKDIVFTEHLKKTDGDGVYLWYGPKGTVTPLHHDTMNIFMAQVRGRKQVKLIPANEIDFIYNNYAVYSEVDLLHPDYERFPKFRHANVIDVELAPGEALFLPVGWWHWVKSLDTAITVAFNNFPFPNDFEWKHPAGGESANGGY
jgi:ribosomal protein L16 Arg81 hydroxylase